VVEEEMTSGMRRDEKRRGSGEEGEAVDRARGKSGLESRSQMAKGAVEPGI
jgi:hypothetical protein